MGEHLLGGQPGCKYVLNRTLLSNNYQPWAKECQAIYFLASWLSLIEVYLCLCLGHWVLQSYVDVKKELVGRGPPKLTETANACLVGKSEGKRA